MRIDTVAWPCVCLFIFICMCLCVCACVRAHQNPLGIMRITQQEFDFYIIRILMKSEIFGSYFLELYLHFV